jgi:P27 family predicted phage terminase small subunit
MPTCPSRLDAGARREWKRLAPELHKMGLLTQWDRAQFAGYCQSWSDYLAALKDIQENGRTFVTPKGYIAKNPMVTIMNEAWSRMHKAAARFGFDPSSRSGIVVGEKSATDEFEEFLQQNVANG